MYRDPIQKRRRCGNHSFAMSRRSDFHDSRQRNSGYNPVSNRGLAWGDPTEGCPQKTTEGCPQKNRSKRCRICCNLLTMPSSGLHLFCDCMDLNTRGKACSFEPLGAEPGGRPEACGSSRGGPNRLGHNSPKHCGHRLDRLLPHLARIPGEARHCQITAASRMTFELLAPLPTVGSSSRWRRVMRGPAIRALAAKRLIRRA